MPLSSSHLLPKLEFRLNGVELSPPPFFFFVLKKPNLDFSKNNIVSNKLYLWFIFNVLATSFQSLDNV